MQEKQNESALIWFRNDLRVQDNAVLQETVNTSKNVIALYCFDPRHFETTLYGFKKTEKFRAQFLIETVADLKHNLAKLNITLLTFYSKPETVIPDIIASYNIDHLFLQKEWTQEEEAVLKK